MQTFGETPNKFGALWASRFLLKRIRVPRVWHRSVIGDWPQSVVCDHLIVDILQKCRECVRKCVGFRRVWEMLHVFAIGVHEIKE